MNAAILTSVFAVLVSVTNLSAKNVITYSNVESNESGTKKEYVTLDKETAKPLSKEFYHYDEKGNVLEKTTSTWNNEKGWVNSSNYTYIYGENDMLSYVAYTKWDNKAEDWSNKSDILVHVYDENNNFLSVKQMQVNNNVIDYPLLSQK
ncbi:DUF3836 domain-containing protein [Prevotella sp. 10(H)]|uniref:DUF3836 domain-containing protein n=1 Tax=Prevotella sp. 10(H) TaxID=1158294 RepID=UPI0004A6C9D1|nr:DUF3836 domain-containing protein [Prevotella sp. 10(H)]